MKKALTIIALTVIITMICVVFSSRGNRTMFDTTHTFTYAYIKTGDGVIQGKVTSWLDFDDSDVVQVTIDEKTYLTHYSNVVLVN